MTMFELSPFCLQSNLESSAKKCDGDGALNVYAGNGFPNHMVVINIYLDDFPCHDNIFIYKYS